MRRQAATTLQTMEAIVRVQAVFRGRRVRMSKDGRAVRSRISKRRRLSSRAGSQYGVCFTSLARTAWSFVYPSSELHSRSENFNFSSLELLEAKRLLLEMIVLCTCTIFNVFRPIVISPQDARRAPAFQDRELEETRDEGGSNERRRPTAYLLTQQVYLVFLNCETTLTATL